jgi:hypothetical protein
MVEVLELLFVDLTDFRAAGFAGTILVGGEVDADLRVVERRAVVQSSP